jgi:FAD/FMN-containing dehydrogenase
MQASPRMLTIALETGKLTAGKLFGPNMDRLLELKKQYDPDNCFRSWHNFEKP